MGQLDGLDSINLKRYKQSRENQLGVKRTKTHETLFGVASLIADGSGEMLKLLAT